MVDWFDDYIPSLGDDRMATMSDEHVALAIIAILAIAFLLGLFSFWKDL